LNTFKEQKRSENSPGAAFEDCIL